MKSILTATAAVLLLSAGFASAQSPNATETASIGGKTVTIKYAAPSVRGRKIFGDGGLISNDPTYPVWRAGANSATAFHTDADLDIGGLAVPKGDYTLFVDLKDPNAWELIVNKQTGQWGLSYDKGQDLGRVKMKMSKAASVEVLKYTLKATGGNKGTLELAWETHAGSVPLTVK
ncbi:MAG: DUF2911 domain-containing protein [Acidobacteriota bacterium]